MRLFETTYSLFLFVQTVYLAGNNIEYEHGAFTHCVLYRRICNPAICQYVWENAETMFFSISSIIILIFSAVPLSIPFFIWRVKQ